MEQRTCNIIMCCKGNGTGDNPRESIAHYMSKECGCDINVYNEGTLFRIMLTALYDYIDTCDRPSSLLRDYFEVREYCQNDFDRIASAFSLACVRDNIGCVNGFTETMLAQSKKEIK